jgi:AraC-like DNA-binding protein
VFFTALARLATRHRIVPAEVMLAQPPENPAPFETYFGTKIRTDEVNRIALSAEDAKRPFLTADSAMWAFFESGIKQRLSDLDAEASIAQRVRSTLLEMLPSGQSSVEEVASRLAMSKRSLQRRLSDEASSYKEILNAMRKELAQHYLSRSSLSPGEISYLLGFQDSNSFIRSSRGWTGTTTGEYRRAQSTG